MFGGFSMWWNGKLLTGEAKTNESQFNYLMELLLHNRQEGVSKDMIQQVLFEDRDINDINHATRSVIYNAKRKLKAAGLPDVNFIEQKKGIYYWTKEIPVEEDASEFERLCREADEEKDLDNKLGLYLEACYAYKGEFLAPQAGVLWIAQESRRYRTLFYACVEKAVQILRVNQDFLQMEELGLYAARICPLADWESVTMEALVSLGRYEEARKFYEDTVDLYFQKEGLKTSSRLMEWFNKLGSQFDYEYEALEDIQNALSEDESHISGGYLCPYPVFQGVYRMVERMMERGGQSVYLMLCVVVDSRGNPMKEGSVLDELSQRLGDAIRHSVRHSDAISKYGRGRYLVLLVNTTREDCEIVQKRINYRFIVGRQRTGIQYYVKSVICSPNRKVVRGKEQS